MDPLMWAAYEELCILGLYYYIQIALWESLPPSFK